MGNRSSGDAGGTRRHEVLTLDKLKLDVELANAMRDKLSAQIQGALGNVAGAVDFVPNLRFHLIVSRRISKRMLPVLWKFNRNVLVEVHYDGANRNVAHFTPIQFYTFFKCLQDVHREASALNKVGGGDGGSDQGTAAEQRQDSVDDTECALCMENKVDVVTTCAHAFCNICLSDWTSQNPDADATCPVCRGILKRDDSGTFALADAGMSTDVIAAMVGRLRGLFEQHREVNPATL